VGFRRAIQIMNGLIFGGGGLLALIAGIAASVPAAIVFGAVMMLLAGLAVGRIEMQIRGVKAKGARVREMMDAVAREVFDAPAEVRPGYDLSVTAGAAAARVAAMETDVGFTTDGQCKGVRVSVASHASALGRQMGELSHVYSHVVVDVLGCTAKFRLSNEGVASRIGRVAGVTEDAKVGDESFDASFAIDADTELARDVLDESIRKRLLELRSQVSRVSQDFGVGTMSVILTSHGLALRWPGEIDPAFAKHIRDLLLDMRTRLLAHEDRKAARAAKGTGYRVVEGEPLPAEEESEEKARAL
jgi:hypothetical protein